MPLPGAACLHIMWFGGCCETRRGQGVVGFIRGMEVIFKHEKGMRLVPEKDERERAGVSGYRYARYPRYLS
ncbi:MAG: hypothetical protein JRF57_07400 [Deltaproteobacteria bacterium]|nr:hypothetical protein [Deltaproteobacteria bacterium]